MIGPIIFGELTVKAVSQNRLVGIIGRDLNPNPSGIEFLAPFSVCPKTHHSFSWRERLSFLISLYTFLQSLCVYQLSLSLLLSMPRLSQRRQVKWVSPLVLWYPPFQRVF
jgi:hypothetical protein